MTQTKSDLGRRNRATGQRFEQKVRKDLELKGWIVARWTNNVSDYPENNINLPSEEREDRKLIPAKSNRFNMRTTGFPDFIAYRGISLDKIGLTLNSKLDNGKETQFNPYVIVGVECKGGLKNKYLDKEEKAKCKWYLKNNIFSKILVATKDIEKKGKIKYEEFK